MTVTATGTITPAGCGIHNLTIPDNSIHSSIVLNFNQSSLTRQRSVNCTRGCEINENVNTASYHNSNSHQQQDSTDGGPNFFFCRSNIGLRPATNASPSVSTTLTGTSTAPNMNATSNRQLRMCRSVPVVAGASASTSATALTPNRIQTPVGNGNTSITGNNSEMHSPPSTSIVQGGACSPSGAAAQVQQIATGHYIPMLVRQLFPGGGSSSSMSDRTGGSGSTLVFSTPFPIPFMYREVYKNGFLKRLAPNEKKSSALSRLLKSDRFWSVFAVHDDRVPFLELWNDPSEISAGNKTPQYILPLCLCRHVSASLVAAENEWTFVFNFDHVAIRFACNSETAMNEWIDVIRQKLCMLGIISVKGNLYSKIPPSNTASTMNVGVSNHPGSTQQQAVLQQDLQQVMTRNPMSPLPTPPMVTSSRTVTPCSSIDRRATVVRTKKASAGSSSTKKDTNNSLLHRLKSQKRRGSQRGKRATKNAFSSPRNNADGVSRVEITNCSGESNASDKSNEVSTTKKAAFKTNVYLDQETRSSTTVSITQHIDNASVDGESGNGIDTTTTTKNRVTSRSYIGGVKSKPKRTERSNNGQATGGTLRSRSSKRRSSRRNNSSRRRYTRDNTGFSASSPKFVAKKQNHVTVIPIKPDENEERRDVMKERRKLSNRDIDELSDHFYNVIQEVNSGRASDADSVKLSLCSTKGATSKPQMLSKNTTNKKTESASERRESFKRSGSLGPLTFEQQFPPCSSLVTARQNGNTNSLESMHSNPREAVSTRCKNNVEHMSIIESLDVVGPRRRTSVTNRHSNNLTNINGNRVAHANRNNSGQTVVPCTSSSSKKRASSKEQQSVSSANFLNIVPHPPHVPLPSLINTNPCFAPPPPRIPHYFSLSRKVGGSGGLATRNAADNTNDGILYRERGVYRLRQEIQHPAGVRLLMRKRDVGSHVLAVVEIFGSLWVAGWKQSNDHPIYNSKPFHIGDLILTANGQPIRTVRMGRPPFFTEA